MAEQASFWEQSDLLALIDAAAASVDRDPLSASVSPPVPPTPPEPQPQPDPLLLDSALLDSVPLDPALSDSGLPNAGMPKAVLSKAVLSKAVLPDSSLSAQAAQVPPQEAMPPAMAESAATTAASGDEGALDSLALGTGSPENTTAVPEPAAADPDPEQEPAVALPPTRPAALELAAPEPAEPEPAEQGPAGSASAHLPKCPERLLVLDTETTALSREHGQCIEVGAVLFHVPSRAVLMQVSFLLPCPSNPAEAINGIPAPVSRLRQPWQAGLTCFEAMVEAADAVVAHNVSFDRQWFGQAPLPVLSKPWICSMEDIRWPAERKLRATPSVRDLALSYGIPVWAAHRALTDCIYLVQVFERCADLEALLQAAIEPRRLYRAQLGYAERHRAKEAGFRWNEPVRGAWSRRLSDREVAALSFAVEAVEPVVGELARSA